MGAPILQRVRAIAHIFNGNGGKLFQRTIRGLFWVFISYGGGRLLSLIRSIVLARLLLPDDFGVVGLADVAIGFLAVIVEMGIAPALIHKQDISDEVLDTAWVLSVLRGLLLGLLTFFAADLVSSFYQVTDLSRVLKVMALLFVISGLNSTGPILLQKAMDFRKLSYFELLANFSSLAITIGLAVVIRNYWALVWGSFAQAVITLAGSYIVHPYRPRLRFRMQAARDILNFGKYIFGGGVVGYFLSQGDNALVGKLLGTGPLGLYRMAYNISNMPGNSITNVIGQVAFPVYAQIQNDIPALRLAYLKILKFTSLLAVPMSIGMMVLAPEIVLVVFGETWVPMTASFIILSVYGLERAVNSSVAPLFKAKGKPKIVFYLTLLKLVLLAAIIYPLTVRYGIVGTSIASSLVAVIISVNVFRPMAKLLECRISTLLQPLVGPFAASGVMMLTLLGLKFAGWDGNNMLGLMGLVVIGVAVYLISLLIFDRITIIEIRQVISAQLKMQDA